MCQSDADSDCKSRCPACGAEAGAMDRFCVECGTPLPTPAPAGVPLEWEIDIPLMTNRFILYDFGKVILWTGLIMFSLLALIFILTGDGGARQLAAVAGMTGIALLVVGLLACLVMAVFFGNRYPTAFCVGEEGVRMASRSRRGKGANRAAIVLGLLARRPGLAGAGLMASSQELAEIRWRDIRSVHEHPDLRVLCIRNSWRVLLRLFCTPENFKQVRDRIASHLPPGAVRPGPGDQYGEAVRRLLLGACAYVAVSFGAGVDLLPWLALGAVAMTASGFARGGSRTALSALAAVAAGVQAAAWPGSWAELLSSGWNAAPVFLGLAAMAAPWFGRLFAAKSVATSMLALFLVSASPAFAAESPKPPWQGFNLFSESMELSLGRSYAAELDRKLKLIRSTEASGAVERTGKRLAAYAPRQAQWRFSLVNTREVNAFAVPGGFIYVNRGLVELANSDDELAGVLAHEIAHVVARHGTRSMSKQILLAAITAGATYAASRRSEKWGDIAAVAGGVGTLMAQLKYSRNDEYQADRLALEIMEKAGYSPYGLVSFFERLRGDRGGRGSTAERWLALVSTHPPMTDRVLRLKPLLVGLPPLSEAGSAEIQLAQAALKSLPYPPASQDAGLSSAVAALGRGSNLDREAPGNLDWSAAHSLRVAGDTVWLPTGITVRPGDGIAIQAEGEIWPIRNSAISCGPEGIPGRTGGLFKPISRANTGALVARIKPASEAEAPKIVLVGQGAVWRAAADGVLELGINDDNNFDNRGEFSVQILIDRKGAR